MCTLVPLNNVKLPIGYYCTPSARGTLVGSFDGHTGGNNYFGSFRPTAVARSTTISKSSFTTSGTFGSTMMMYKEDLMKQESTHLKKSCQYYWIHRFKWWILACIERCQYRYCYWRVYSLHASYPQSEMNCYQILQLQRRWTYGC